MRRIKIRTGDNHMETGMLKEYLRNVLALEEAIYQTNQIKSAYQEKRERNKPQQHICSLPSPPAKPTFINPDIKFMPTLNSSPALYWPWGLGIVAMPLGLLSAFALMCVGDTTSPTFCLCLIAGVIGTIAVILSTMKAKQLQNEQIEAAVIKNKQNQEKYRTDLENYESLRNNLQKKNEFDRIKDNKILQSYNVETVEALQKLSNIEQTLKTSLYNLYAKNVIYAKYRNLVTVSTLYEYIDSGRCFELEGPNGAYNLYEGELRADIIISSLNNIISNLESIRNNQYTLYQTITRTNATTHELLRDINNSQMLTSYYAKQAALAASADRYIVGMIW